MLSNGKTNKMTNTTIFEIPPYNAADMITGRPPLTPPTENGLRLAALRREAELSQREVAEALGIPQRTVSFYERQASHLPSNLLPKLAELFGVPIEMLLGAESANGKKTKRGPKSELERRFDKVRTLPKRERELAIDMLDRIINAAESGKHDG